MKRIGQTRATNDGATFFPVHGPKETCDDPKETCDGPKETCDGPEHQG